MFIGFSQKYSVFSVSLFLRELRVNDTDHFGAIFDPGSSRSWPSVTTVSPV